MQTRRFNILYKRDRDLTLEREVVGTPEQAMAVAWQMLQEGAAKVAAIVEVGNLEFHIWHDAIVRWGSEQSVRALRPGSQIRPRLSAARNAA